MIWITLLLGISCKGDMNEKKDITSEENDVDSFARDESVRIVFPENGAIVEDAFYLQYEAGDNIAHLELYIDNQFSASLDKTKTEHLLHLEEGPHTLSLQSLNTAAEVVQAHTITVTVPSEHWVTIVSPSNGATVTNPVQFTVNASNNIDSIELFADDWSLGTIYDQEVLSYPFTGTGFEREIVAVGYQQGLSVAEHVIHITVDPGTAPIPSTFNDYVTSILEEYPTDGSYGYYWPSSGGWLGTTEDIVYQGTIIAEGDPNNRSYCVGITFEVFMKAWMQIDDDFSGDGTINGMSVSDLHDFRLDWYVRDLFGAGPADAVDAVGIGELVTNWDDVQPGDFLQFWRHSGSGHNVIFIDWEWDMEGNRIGFLYWSTQGSTDGIGYNSEYFGNSGSRVNPQYFFPARVYTPENWINWQ